MIVSFDYEKTAAHRKEMEVTAEMVKADGAWHKETLDRYETLSEFYREYFRASVGAEFARATADINRGPRLKILDMGAGRGETSLYLANFGHDVSPVEPSLAFCEVIDYVGSRFGKNLTIYNCSAEQLDIPGEQFDAVTFNCSLHHCDDPVMALKNAYRVLKAGGKLYVTGDPFLPFFKSRESWLRDLDASPEETGHYGGNEHIYSNNEYVAMIRQAGFEEVRPDVAARYRTKEAVSQSLADDRHRSKLRNAVKSLWCHIPYFLMRTGLGMGTALLQRLSLVQSSFTSTK